MKKKLVVAILLAAVLLLAAGCSSVPVVTVEAPIASVEGEQDLSPYQIKETKAEQEPVPIEDHLSYVDTDYLMKLFDLNGATSRQRTAYEQYSPDWSFVLIDSRPQARFNESHINGSINIPDGQFHDLAHLLPEDKDKMLIFYCGGWHCPLSPASANKALELGYTNVHVYQEGTDAWEAAGNYMVTTPEYVQTLIESARVSSADTTPSLIIDSRPYGPYFAASIPTAINIDDILFVEKYLDAMPKDKNTEIVTYCGGFFCGKSHYIAQTLADQGYTNVKVLAGGVPAWKSSGLPLFGTEAAGIDFDISGGQPDRSINSEQFREKLTAGATVVDVRNDSEVASGMISNAIHIPDTLIHLDAEAIASKLPENKDATILIHCASGARAAGVVERIANLGYENTFYLDGSIVIDSSGNYSF
ncbi:rhodanese-related sulfurtransferase [Desulfitispora alkaliphila]|uniref:rhodanese-like domain-containing protein n=1 Tax=Desulfitispora alkaliphila TaxID=622674 RepID=UPI003D1EC4BA